MGNFLKGLREMRVVAAESFVHALCTISVSLETRCCFGKPFSVTAQMQTSHLT
eukprot:SAG31_NODE_2873_length_4972_cov_3.088241_4_plen_53_part_00